MSSGIGPAPSTDSPKGNSPCQPLLNDHSSTDLSQAAGNASADEFRRATLVLQRCAFMFRRKMGHEREDPAYDRLVRSKIVHIFFFSMLGLAGTVVMDILPHQKKIDTPYGVNVFDKADGQTKVILLCLQVLISASTLITLGLIIQYYYLLLMNKRKEWSGIDVAPVLEHETSKERARRMKEKDTLEASYSLWASTPFCLAMLCELALHSVHPIIFFSGHSSIFEACKVVVITRLYLTLRLLHFLSSAYRSRFEIVNQYDEFKSMNLKITAKFTLKSHMHVHTGIVICAWAVATVLVGGFGMYVVERDASTLKYEKWMSDVTWSHDLGNSLWFAFVTATTIGYGDYYPVTFKGRLMAMVIGIVGLFVLVVFKALLTNQLKPSKYETYIKEYLADAESRDHNGNAAATLIQRVWRYKRAVRLYANIPVFHKSNTVFAAVKSFRAVRYKLRHAETFEGASDVVLDTRMEQLMAEAGLVSVALQQQRVELLQLHRKVQKQLRSVKERVCQRRGINMDEL